MYVFNCMVRAARVSARVSARVDAISSCTCKRVHMCLYSGGMPIQREVTRITQKLRSEASACMLVELRVCMHVCTLRACMQAKPRIDLMLERWLNEKYFDMQPSSRAESQSHAWRSLSAVQRRIKAQWAMLVNYLSLGGFLIFCCTALVVLVHQRRVSVSHGVETVLKHRFIDTLPSGFDSRKDVMNWISSIVTPIFEDPRCGDGTCSPPEEFPAVDRVGCSADCGYFPNTTELKLTFRRQPSNVTNLISEFTRQRFNGYTFALRHASRRTPRDKEYEFIPHGARYRNPFTGSGPDDSVTTTTMEMTSVDSSKRLELRLSPGAYPLPNLPDGAYTIEVMWQEESTRQSEPIVRPLQMLLGEAKNALGYFAAACTWYKLMRSCGAFHTPLQTPNVHFQVNNRSVPSDHGRGKGEAKKGKGEKDDEEEDEDGEECTERLLGALFDSRTNHRLSLLTLSSALTYIAAKASKGGESESDLVAHMLLRAKERAMQAHMLSHAKDHATRAQSAKAAQPRSCEADAEYATVLEHVLSYYVPAPTTTVDFFSCLEQAPPSTDWPECSMIDQSDLADLEVPDDSQIQDPSAAYRWNSCMHAFSRSAMHLCFV